MKSIRWVVLYLVAAVQACGGGGGSSGISLSTNSLSFSARANGTLPAAQTIHVHVNDSKAVYLGVGYRNGQTEASWLSPSITGSGQDFDVVFGINTTDEPVGTLSAKPTIGTADAEGNILDEQDVSVSYQLKAGVAITSPAVSLLLTQGAAAQVIPVAVSTDGLQYQVTSSVSWLQVPTGTLSASSFNVTAAAASLAPGHYSGTIAITGTDNATDTSSLAVSLAVQPNRLLVSDTGIALAQFPSRSVLTRSVTVSSLNGRTDLPWQAQSSQAWLTATTSGNTGGTLTLSANPQGLTADSFYEATVTVSSGDTTLANQESIRVGLWVGSSNPQSGKLNTNTSNSSASNIAVNPVEPVLYFSDGVSITRYNLYTAASMGSFPAFATSIGQMRISPDGRTLYVYDTSNDLDNGVVRALDADSGSVGASYPNTNNFPFTTGRVDGRDILAYGNGLIVDVASGATLTTLPINNTYSAGVPALSRDGRNLYVLGIDTDASDITYYKLAYSWLDSSLGATAQSPEESNFSCGSGSDLVVSPNQSLVYVACGSPYAFAALDGTTLDQVQTLNSGPYPTATAVSWNGLFVGAGGTDGNQISIEIFDPTGKQVAIDGVGAAGSFNLLPRNLIVSGDGSIAAALLYPYDVALVPMP